VSDKIKSQKETEQISVGRDVGFMP